MVLILNESSNVIPRGIPASFTFRVICLSASETVRFPAENINLRSTFLEIISTYINPRIIDCYEPRLGFIYFKDNKVIGQTQICLSCVQLHSTVETVKEKFGDIFNEKSYRRIEEVKN